MSPRVLNKHKDVITKDAVYIGRGSKWGNIFSSGPSAKSEYRVQSREEAIAMHRWAITELISCDPDFLQQIKNELRGRDLICFCNPKPCHGDILLKLANTD